MGETGDELARRARDAGLDRVERAADVRDAVRKAAALAKPGSVVLLSPAFTSFDMFRDYEDRGRRFKATVLEEVSR
jgi:UDP-N-acetylmuramoylalanine--D-glutamate ligase